MLPSWIKGYKLLKKNICSKTQKQKDTTSWKQWLLLMLAWMLMIGVSYLKGSIRNRWTHDFNPKPGLLSFKQGSSHRKVEIVKLWQLKISFVWKMKSFESNFEKVIPFGSSLSCSISDLGLGFNAWPYQHFIQFQHQQFSLFKKLEVFFFIEYFSGRPWLILFGLSPPTGSNRETS